MGAKAFIHRTICVITHHYFVSFDSIDTIASFTIWILLLETHPYYGIDEKNKNECATWYLYNISH